MPRALGVLGDRLEAAPEAGPLDHVVDGGNERHAERDHEQRAQLEGRAPDRDDPFVARRVNGIGSGKTYAERGKATARMFSIANAIATVAATQPSVDPRTRYWWMTAK